MLLNLVKVMFVVNIVHRTCQVKYSIQFCVDFSKIVLSHDVINWPNKTLNATDMFFNLIVVMLPINLIHWTFQVFQ